MGKLLTLIAAVGNREKDGVELPAGFVIRRCLRADTDALGRLYFEAYEPGVACDTLDEAIADIRASFDGEYGELWPSGSLVIHRGGQLVAATLTVRRARWEATPDCPFVIELFTARAYRRLGLARCLIDHCLAAAHRAGETAVALRVDEGNAAARSLYHSVGFTVWQPR